MSAITECERLVRASIPPGILASIDLHGYRKVTVCPECGRRGAYEDQHPASPCRLCGARVKESVGVWVGLYRPWWKFWESERGFWALKSEAE